MSEIRELYQEMIIATRDHHDLLKRIVKDILKRTDYSPLELWIADNNSTDPYTVAYLDKIARKDNVHVITYEKPFNYSAINNLAVRKGQGDVICFLNNDIQIQSSDWLKEMVSFAWQDNVGAVGAKLLYPNNNIQHAGVVLGMSSGVADHPFRHLSQSLPGYHNRAQVIQEFSAVTAACMVMRRTIFNEIGGFDEENLGVAYNDIDLCLRVREKGYQIVWTPYAKLLHLESASRGSDQDTRDRFQREFLHMKSKWGNVLLNDPFYNPNLSLDKSDFSLAFPPRQPKPW